MVKLQKVSILLLVVVVAWVECQERMPLCNFVTNMFKNRRCVERRRFPCGMLDWKMDTLNCKEFACENYREFDSFCTNSCVGLEIANGLCTTGNVCCIAADTVTDMDPTRLKPIEGSNAFELQH